MNSEYRDKCEALFKQFEPQLRRICRVKLRGRPDDTDDVISDVFTALCEKFEKDGAPDNPQAWLYGVLNNKINLRFRDIYKTAEKETSFDDREYELPYADDLIDKKIDEVYNSEIKNRLQKLLSSDEYELIKAIHFEKLKMKEAAERFGSTESAVKQKHYRICRKLRKIIGSPEDLI